MNYGNAIDKFAKALSDDFSPEQIGQAPNSTPPKVDVQSETLSVAEQLSSGSIAGYPSDRLLDKKEHFPVITQTQAQSSMARVMQLAEAPSWYNGTIAQLRQDVYDGIMKMHPEITLNVRVPVEVAVALSDGQTESETVVKDPNADRKNDEVPQVARPTLTSAEVALALQDEDTRKAVAGRLMEMIDKQLESIQTAKKLGQRLLKSGLKPEEFDQLSTFIQEDILRALVARGVTASQDNSEERRQELLARMTAQTNPFKGPRKPTDGDKKKKKKENSSGY
jgi:hypothetical protein